MRPFHVVVLSGLLALAACPPEQAAPVPDLAVPADLAAPPDLTADAAMPADLALPYVQQPGCSKDAWCWLTPRPQGNTLLAVWGSGPADIWAGGYSGALVHYDGSGWQPVLSPTRATIHGLWGADASNVFLVGDLATALRWDGTAFVPLPLPASPARRITTLYAVFGTSATDVWMVGAGGVALHYDGVTTTEVPTPDLGELRAVWGPTAASTYAVSSLGTEVLVLHYDPGTKAFTKVRTLATPATPTALWGTSDDTYFVATGFGEIYQLSKTAATPVHAKSSYGINALWGRGTTVYAVGDIQYRMVVPPDSTARAGSLLSLSGATFTEVSGAPATGFFALWGSSPTDLYFVGTAGTIAHYDGSKFTTTSLHEPLTGVGAPLTGLAATASGELLAVGDFGAALLWNGTAWTPRPDDVHRRYRALSGSGDRLLAIVQDLRATTGSELGRWTGTAFSAETLPSSTDLRAVHSTNTIAVAVGASDLILQRSGTGTWSRATVETPGTTVLRAAYALSSSNVWVVGGGDVFDNPSANPPRILHSDGTSYRSVPCPVSDVILRGLWAASATAAWAVGSDGTALRWNGATWQPVPLTTLATLNAVWGRDPTTVYAVGQNGTILRWNGTAWHPEDSGTPSNLLQVWGTATEVYALGANGTVLRKSLR